MGIRLGYGLGWAVRLGEVRLGLSKAAILGSRFWIPRNRKKRKGMEEMSLLIHLLVQLVDLLYSIVLYCIKLN